MKIKIEKVWGLISQAEMQGVVFTRMELEEAREEITFWSSVLVDCEKTEKEVRQELDEALTTIERMDKDADLAATAIEAAKEEGVCFSFEFFAQHLERAGLQEAAISVESEKRRLQRANQWGDLASGAVIPRG